MDTLRYVYFGLSHPDLSDVISETARANTAGDHHNPRPQHDILEVNEYLTSSLQASPIDKWFTGLATPTNRESIGVPSERASIDAAIAKALGALDEWDQTAHDVSPSPPRAPHALVTDSSPRATSRFPGCRIGRKGLRSIAYRTEPGQAPANPRGSLQGDLR